MPQEKTPKKKATKPRTSRKKAPNSYNQDAVVKKNDGKKTLAERHAVEKAEKLKKAKLPIILIAVIVLVVAGIVTALLLLNNSGDHTDATAGEAVDEINTEPTETEPRDLEVGTDILAQYSTEISGTEDRTHNLVLACQAVDGTVLDEDEEFSFNDVLGERTEEKGYRPASIYSDGDVIDGIGGGICQVASTLYLVALKSDLEITERHAHQYPVSYLPLGMDASIYWGSQDLRFVNTSGAPLRIRANVKNNCVNIAIEGTKQDDGYIRISYEVMDTYEYDEIKKVDESKESGYRSEETSGITGYLVQTFYNYFDAEDNLIKKEECAWSDYNKRDRVLVVGPGEEENDDEPTTKPSESTQPSSGISDSTTDPYETPIVPIDPPTEATSQSGSNPTEPTEKPSEAPTEATTPTEATEPSTQPTTDSGLWDDELPTVPPFEYDN